MTPADVLSAFLRADQAAAAQLAVPEPISCGAAACGVAYCAADHPHLPDANHLLDVLLLDITPAQAIEAVDAHFTARGRRCLRWRLSVAQPPEAVGAALEPLGWRRRERIVLGHREWPALDALRPPAASGLRILPARAMRGVLRQTVLADVEQWPDAPAPVSGASASAIASAASARESAAAALQERMNDSELDIFVATLDGAAAGRITLHQVGDILRIDDLFVTPALRGRGVGHALVRHVVNLAYRLRPRAFVADGAPRGGSDAAARRLAEEYGFAECGRCAEWTRTG